MGKPSASSMAGCTASAKDLVPNSRSVTSAASTMPGTSAERMPATGTQSFKPCGFGRIDDLVRLSLCLRKKSAVASLGMVPTPAMA